MRSALIEMSAVVQPIHRFAHWFTQQAGNDELANQSSSFVEPQVLSQYQLLVRPRLGKARKLSVKAANSERIQQIDLFTAAAPIAAPAPLQLASHNTNAAPNPECAKAQSRPALRVVVKPDATGGTGRMVISGRMADVCAELDRLVCQER